MNVQDEIKAGRYNNTMPYDREAVPVDEDKMTVRQAREHAEEGRRLRREHRANYRAEDYRLRAVFQRDLEEEFGLQGHPKADLVFAKAWEDGHSSGWLEVYWHYAGLAELVK